MKFFKDIDEHIDQFPLDVQEKLEEIRAMIHAKVPEASEAIKYGIPTFVYKKKNLIHFAGYSTHIGFYPGAAAIEEFASRLSDYTLSKGTIQLPLDQAPPLTLLRDIVIHRKQVIDAGQ